MTTLRLGGRNSLNGDANKIIGQLRRTHLLTNYGPGAIVDMPGYSVIMGSCDYWKQAEPVMDRRLANYLRVQEFRQPHADGNDGQDKHYSVQAFRFPEWCYCPKCGRLGPYWQISGDKAQRQCAKCNVDLVPSRFVAGCTNGHIQDFPYIRWVHRGESCDNPELKVRFKQETGSLAGIEIECTTCGAKRTMAGCTTKGTLATSAHCRCQGMKPWLKKSDYIQESCDAPLVTLQRGASNVYFPETVSALTLPFRMDSYVEKHYELLEKLVNAGMDDAIQTILKGSDTDLTVEEVISQIRGAQSAQGEDGSEEQTLYLMEYQALRGPAQSDAQFDTEHEPVPEGYEGLISKVTLVNRLREVMVLRGFRRVVGQPKIVNGNGSEVEVRLVQPGSKETPSWLPAMEMLGEGIFIELDEEKLREWEDKVGARYDSMDMRRRASSVSCPNFSPAFVLLHTFAHLLIRQLSLDCGYSGSALKERIYSTYPDTVRENHMAGILVYTSSSDSDGSLGGLVRQGKKDRLGVTLDSMLENATWCSSDPICIDSEGQGLDSLNYAACHACTLLPETSCTMRNCFLDRAALVGTLNKPEMGFFAERISMDAKS